MIPNTHILQILLGVLTLLVIVIIFTPKYYNYNYYLIIPMVFGYIIGYTGIIYLDIYLKPDIREVHHTSYRSGPSAKEIKFTNINN